MLDDLGRPDVVAGRTSFLALGARGGQLEATQLAVDNEHAVVRSRVTVGGDRSLESPFAGTQAAVGSWFVAARGCVDPHEQAIRCTAFGAVVYRLTDSGEMSELGAYPQIEASNFALVGATEEQLVVQDGSVSKDQQITRYWTISVRSGEVAPLGWEPPTFPYSPGPSAGRFVPERSTCIAHNAVFVLDRVPSETDRLVTSLHVVPLAGGRSDALTTVVDIPGTEVPGHLICDAVGPTMIAMDSTRSVATARRFDDHGVLTSLEEASVPLPPAGLDYGSSSVVIRTGASMSADEGAQVEEGAVPAGRLGLVAYSGSTWSRLPIVASAGDLVSLSGDGRSLLVRHASGTMEGREA
jgi:hypothetical protein